MSKISSASGDVWRRMIRVPCQAALSICYLAEADQINLIEPANEPGHVVGIELLLLAKALESGTDGELVNWRWLDGSLMCLESCHCRLRSGYYLVALAKEISGIE
jgi:hypothetical protein